MIKFLREIWQDIQGVAKELNTPLAFLIPCGLAMLSIIIGGGLSCLGVMLHRYLPLGSFFLPVRFICMGLAFLTVAMMIAVAQEAYESLGDRRSHNFAIILFAGSLVVCCLFFVVMDIALVFH